MSTVCAHKDATTILVVSGSEVVAVSGTDGRVVLGTVVVAVLVAEASHHQAGRAGAEAGGAATQRGPLVRRGRTAEVYRA